MFLARNISFSQKAIFQPAVERLVKFSNLVNSYSAFREALALDSKIAVKYCCVNFLAIVMITIDANGAAVTPLGVEWNSQVL